jgi:SAM-dependent methyltransferase
MSESSGWNVPGSWVEIYETIFVPGMMGEWAPRVMALAHPRSEEHILDVACGTGALTRCVAQSIGRNGRVVGLDLSPEMLAVARASGLNGTQPAPIEWREGDAGALPFDDASFDVVFCAFGLMFFPDRVAALKDMRRVLKPDGRLALSVWGPISQCPGQLAMRQTWERHFGAENAAGFSRQHALGDPEMIRELLHCAGYRDVSVEPQMGAVRLPSPEVLARSYGAMAGTPADESIRATAIQEVSAALQPYVGANGLEYPIAANLACARR